MGRGKRTKNRTLLAAGFSFERRRFFWGNVGAKAFVFCLKVPGCAFEDGSEEEEGEEAA